MKDVKEEIVRDKCSRRNRSHFRKKKKQGDKQRYIQREQYIGGKILLSGFWEMSIHNFSKLSCLEFSVNIKVKLGFLTGKALLSWWSFKIFTKTLRLFWSSHFLSDPPFSGWSLGFCILVMLKVLHFQRCLDLHLNGCGLHTFRLC